MFLQTSLVGGLGPSFSRYVSSNTSSTVDNSVAASPFCCLPGLWFLVSVSVIFKTAVLKKRINIGYSISYTHSHHDLRAGSKHNQFNPGREQLQPPGSWSFCNSDSMHPIVNYAFVSGVEIYFFFLQRSTRADEHIFTFTHRFKKGVGATGVYRCRVVA